jgi:outer membrane protein OmpA-like peptidoglycan-associated protein
VIDPLIDGVTGAQSAATLLEEKQIITLVKENYPRFAVAPFSADALAKSPVVLIGTFTAINNAGWLTANVTFFADSPVFASDPSIEAYVKSCQGAKPGDPISPAYANRILVSSLVAQPIEAYDAKLYGDALELYRLALRAPGGEQLRVLNGVYLANEALRRHKDAVAAFGNLVDFGLKGDKLAVKFLFQPGSTLSVPDPRSRSTYDSWLATIADRAVSMKSCLEIVAHTSATGIPAISNELSVLRAQYVKDRLEADNTLFGERLIVTGKGSRELMVGTGRDDASDALDRRVEFNVIKCGG